MDIPVSRLNQRMALQLPAELPLGLVFVVGEVQLSAAGSSESEGDQPGDFYLEDEGYRLRCRLSERTATEFHPEAGDLIRAGGHLVFEPVLASYYLLARDVERLDGLRPSAKALAAIIADSARREQATSLVPAELPTWVKQMAPLEVRSQQADQPLADGAALTSSHLNGEWELLADTGAAMAFPEAEPALADLSDELIAFLSQAMDSEVEVEITPEIMTDLNTTGSTERLSPEVLEALDLFEASVSQETQVQAAEQQQPKMVADRSPQEQVLAWLEPDTEATEETITVAEVAAALESAAPTGDAVQATTQAQPTATKDQPKTAPRNKSNGTIPWVMALLIIIIVVVVLAVIVYVVMFPSSLPFDLSLDLPQEIPALN